MKTKITISLLVTVSFLFITNVLQAQWTLTGTNIYPTTVTNWVGIGTTGPSNALDIISPYIGSTAWKSGLRLNKLKTPTNPNGSVLTVDSTGDVILVKADGNDWHIKGNTATTASTAAIGSYVNNNFIGTNDAKDWVMATDSLERMRITSTGNVGIGTNVPSAMLTTVNSNSVKTLVSQSLTTSQTAPTTVPTANYLQLGQNEYGQNSYRLIQFGFNNALGAYSPAYIGYQEVGTPAGSTYGDLVFGTRPTQGNTIPEERMRINTAGKVGIGTTTPASKLDVEGEISIGTNYSGTITAPPDGAIIEGYVGIGTSAPVYQLHIEGNVSAGSGVRERIRNLSSSSSTYSVLEFGNDAYPLGGGFFLNSSTNTSIYGGANSVNLVNVQNFPLAFGTSNTIRMTVTGAGNVGIGTTGPGVKLHVAGDAGLLRLEGSTQSFMEFYAQGAGTRSAWLGYGAAANTPDLGIYNERTNGDIILSTVGTGKVGIGTASPSYLLDVNGTSYFNGTLTINGLGWISGAAITSDQMFKTNVDSLQNALTTIHQLKPKSYYLDTANVYGLNFSNKKQYGFIAQDVETVLPELIITTTKPADIDTLGNIVHPAVTYKGLNYNAFIGILTKGVQEQSNEIDSLKTKTTNQDSVNTNQQQINDSLMQRLFAGETKANNQDSVITSLQNQLNQLTSLINDCCNNNGNNGNHGNNLMPSGTNNYKSISPTTHTDVELSNKNIVILNQNVPNPFAEQTSISYYLPDNVQRAQILFFEQSGKIIKTVDLTEKGKGQLNVFANDLTSGIYTYSLIVDGQTMETKKMVKAK